MIDFPTPTAVGEQFEDAASGNSWEWDGITWNGLGSANSVAVGAIPPLAPSPGDLWFRSDIGQLFVSYGSATQQAWVQAVTGVGIGGGANVEFPSAPALDQVYVHAPSGNTWIWDGVAWVDQAQEETLSIVATANFDLYVATTGSDTTGDGTQANPFASPHRAMAELGKYIIPAGIMATVRIANGIYNFTKTCYLDHPYGSRITITGESVTGTKPSVATLIGDGTFGDKPTGAAINEGILKGYFNTQLYFLECDAFSIAVGQGITLDKMLVAQAAGRYRTSGVVLKSSCAIKLPGDLAIHGFNVGVNGSGTPDMSCFITNSYNGFFLSGNLTAISPNVSCCNTAGLISGASMTLGGATNKCNGGYVVNASGAVSNASIRVFDIQDTALLVYGSFQGTVTAYGTVKNLVTVDGGYFRGGCAASSVAITGDAVVCIAGRMVLESSNIVKGSGARSAAIKASKGSVISGAFYGDGFPECGVDLSDSQAYLAEVTFNGSNMLVSAVRSRVVISNPLQLGTANGPIAVMASRGSFIDMPAGAGSLTCSPAINTTGNSQSFILA